jgi:phage FluMu gp28-like protein
MLDPQIIPQKWGGNLWTHSVDIQSSLLGIDRNLNRDCLDKNKYKKQTVHASPIDYPVCDTLTTEQSRVIMPAWTARDLQQNHAYILPNNPQAHTEMSFQNYTSTRILEKDNFKKQYNCIPQNNQFYTAPVFKK